MIYGIVLPIHAAAMAAAFAAFVIGELLLVPARRGQSAPARMALRAGRAGNLLAGVGVVAGLTLLLAGGWSLLTPWLLVSFALIAALMTVQSRLVRPWDDRVRAALRGEPSHDEIKAFARERTALIGRATVIALLGAVAALMAMKPDLAWRAS